MLLQSSPAVIHVFQVGTVYYMAPEVMRGEVRSAQSAKIYLKVKIDGTDNQKVD